MLVACMLVAVLSKWVAEYRNMILEVTAVEYHHITLYRIRIIGRDGFAVSVEHSRLKCQKGSVHL